MDYRRMAAATGLLLAPMAAMAQSCLATADGETLVAAPEPEHGFGFRLPDGRRLRLHGVDMPAGDARQAFAATLARSFPAPVMVRIIGTQDRHGRWPALLASENIDVGEALLAAGHVYHDGSASDPCFAIYRQAEAEAMRKKSGLWGDALRPISATDTHALLARSNQFAVIEGTITSIRPLRGIIYLNFAHMRAKALSLTLLAKEKPAFQASGLEPDALTGQKVRARGIITFTRNLQMRLEGPEALERISP